MFFLVYRTETKGAHFAIIVQYKSHILEYLQLYSRNKSVTEHQGFYANLVDTF